MNTITTIIEYTPHAVALIALWRTATTPSSVRLALRTYRAARRRGLNVRLACVIKRDDLPEGMGV